MKWWYNQVPNSAILKNMCLSLWKTCFGINLIPVDLFLFVKTRLALLKLHEPTLTLIFRLYIFTKHLDKAKNKAHCIQGRRPLKANPGKRYIVRLYSFCFQIFIPLRVVLPERWNLHRFFFSRSGIFFRITKQSVGIRPRSLVFFSSLYLKSWAFRTGLQFFVIFFLKLWQMPIKIFSV